MEGKYVTKITKSSFFLKQIRLSILLESTSPTVSQKHAKVNCSFRSEPTHSLFYLVLRYAARNTAANFCFLFLLEC